MDRHTKAYGIYYWDTFDNETSLVAEATTLAKARKIVQEKYGSRIQMSGADRVNIVDRKGKVIDKYNIG